MPADRLHRAADLGRGEIRRGPATPVDTAHRSPYRSPHQRKLSCQVPHIGSYRRASVCDILLTGTTRAARLAKREVQVQAQRRRAARGPSVRPYIRPRAKRLINMWGRRIAGVTRRRRSIPIDQVGSNRFWQGDVGWIGHGAPHKSWLTVAHRTSYPDRWSCVDGWFASGDAGRGQPRPWGHAVPPGPQRTECLMREGGFASAVVVAGFGCTEGKLQGHRGRRPHVGLILQSGYQSVLFAASPSSQRKRFSSPYKSRRPPSRPPGGRSPWPLRRQRACALRLQWWGR